MAEPTSHRRSGSHPPDHPHKNPKAYYTSYNYYDSNEASYDIADAPDERRFTEIRDTQPLRHTEREQRHHVATAARESSMLRRLSTRFGLAKPRVSRALKRSEYTSIAEDGGNTTALDPASLAGLGFELVEVRTKVEPAFSSENGPDTSYQSASGPVVKPSFASFRKRQSLGYGMVIGAQLKPSPSRHAPEPTNQSSEREMKRMKTMRQVGRSLAEERGQMVAYDAPIDLSSLDGMGLPVARSSTFDSMNLSRASTMPDTQSYFFPTDPNRPDWKPFSMRLPYIATIGAIALGLAGFQEYLCQMSIRKQAETPKSALLAFDSVDEVSVGLFFVWKYLPTIITISYAVLYSIMDFDIRRLEPFYQLSKPQGARASASLNLDHLTMFQYFIPFTAARLGQWTVVVSSIANIVSATVAPALQNPSVNFEPNPLCKGAACPEGDGQRFWVLIDPIWSRLLTVAYAIVGCCTLFLAIKLRRSSGLLSNPQGIAGIASMATKSHILHDFKGLDLATRGDIHQRLAHRTYVLHKSSIWQGEFNWHPENNEFHDSDKRLASPHPIMLRSQAAIPFIVVLVVCLGLIPVISLTPARVVPNKLPWLPILIATLIKLVWSTFEADVRMMEPFYQLSKGQAKPQNSITLDYQATVYGWMPIRAALNKHFLVALVGLSSVLLDVFSVTVGSFSVDSVVFLKGNKAASNGVMQDAKTNDELSSQDESYASFWASLVLSLAILMFVIAVACLVYFRRRHPFLPREPSTIAAVLSFIYSSKMLLDFVDTEHLDARAMENRLKGLGKTYGLGWFRGRDGKTHCAIDEEPMLSKYTHGVPYSAAVVSGPLPDHETAYTA